MKPAKFNLYNAQGLLIRGELVNYQPDRKVLLFVHGFGGFMAEPQFKFFRKYFLARNYAVCTFDLTNSLGKSQRNVETLSFEGMHSDVKVVIRYLKNRGISAVNVISHSMGSALMINLITAKDLPNNFVEKLVLINPLVKYVDTYVREAVKRNVTKAVRKGVEYAIFRRFLKRLEVPTEFFKKLESFDNISKAQALDVPSLFILGVLDKTTPAVHGENFASNMIAPHKVLKYENLGHRFFHPNAQKLLPKIAEDIVTWFKQ